MEKDQCYSIAYMGVFRGSFIGSKHPQNESFTVIEA